MPRWKARGECRNKIMASFFFTSRNFTGYPSTLYYYVRFISAPPDGRFTRKDRLLLCLTTWIRHTYLQAGVAFSCHEHPPLRLKGRIIYLSILRNCTRPLCIRITPGTNHFVSNDNDKLVTLYNSSISLHTSVYMYMNMYCTTQLSSNQGCWCKAATSGQLCMYIH